MTMDKIKTNNRFAVKAGAMIAAMLMMTGIASADNFGAISFSTANGARGWSNDYNSQNEAEQRALNECYGAGGTGCIIAIWFSNACGSLAVGNGYGWGAGWDGNRNRADNKALRACRSHNNVNCQIVESVCNSNAY